ncbi:hypothetical protein N2599_33650 (plasmid) [Rhizobium sullae]|uniref:Transmembrane protein n=1 Tax=Rhizobium sullae TaxID=50338 RepID=A0A2N0DFE7_RHISU|nr:hypothetical protein [Rhizobium sullae]PKA44822.1 hypothetical protein CWR43_03040 [Rhizobium sullae]UWU17664.1 hypothetical protein N2599_33650 [Rhizobium sullae]
MKPLLLMLNVATVVVTLVLAVAPVLSAIPAEARQAAAACGRHGCAAAACGPRGCAAAAATRRPRGVVVLSPNRYWRPGGAIAAGAAVGFLAGAAAASVAGSPPQSGYCWYYTNSARTTGFWDVCPN